jgi:flavin reductase (DIM6/NTAB) family NADH-FMN oxidoreductase RutF
MGEPAAVDERVFREAISHFATGVTVITTLADAGPLVYFRSGLCSAPAYLRLRR